MWPGETSVLEDKTNQRINQVIREKLRYTISEWYEDSSDLSRSFPK